MTEYSPWPGTLRSNTLEVTDEPWTKNRTGRAGSPALGAPSRLRYIHSGISPFLAQYSLLQISPPSDASAVAACAGMAPVIPAATPTPMPLITARRGTGCFEPVIAALPFAPGFLVRCCCRHDSSPRACLRANRRKRASLHSTMSDGPTIL